MLNGVAVYKSVADAWHLGRASDRPNPFNKESENACYEAFEDGQNG